MMGTRGYVLVGIIVVAVAAAWLFVARSHAPSAAPDPALSRTSGGGVYLVTIEPETPPLRHGELHSWIARIETAAGDAVVDARITVDGGMPQHGHGLPTAPAASHIGDGHYRIEGVRFNMAGWWEFRLIISGPAGDDEVTFNIKL